MFARTSKIFLVVCASGLVASCSLFDEKPVEDDVALYARAKEALLNSNYASAITSYEELEIKYPFHKNARNAALELAYAYYKNDSSLRASEKVDFFIQQYPGDPRIDYAHYLKGVANYNYSSSILYEVINFDRTDKDPRPLIDAFNAFSHLIARHPDSLYVDSAQRHLSVILNTLAVYEIKVADYYFQRKAYVATVNRVKYLLEHYKGAQHVPDGLLLMAEAYRKLGRDKLADDTRRVLELNFPEFADRRLDPDGRLRIEADKSWLQQLNDISDTFLESVRLKPRY